MAPTLRTLALCLIGTAGATLGVAAASAVQAARKPGPAASAIVTPEIIMSAHNRVPACIDPDRFDQILAERNPRLEPRFRGIARLYQTHGERLGIRWDYAFYQMVLETNSLKFTGDVRARQNNFAGLGATGGGVPGESFPDVSSGVLAQLQHLVAYAGTKVDNPVAKRTRDNQNDIISRSKKLGRAVRFADLTNRWAADGRYALSIDTLATLFRDASCGKRDLPTAAAPQPQATAIAAPTNNAILSPKVTKDAVSTTAPAASRPGRTLARKAIDTLTDGTPLAKPAGLGAAPAIQIPECSVMRASFGGTVTLLIRAEGPGKVTFTALGVEDAAADVMASSYIGMHAQGGRIVGRFASTDEAVGRAYAQCDSGRP